MNDSELDKLMGIFYTEAPYDYIIDPDEKHVKGSHGWCDYQTKICNVWIGDTYERALFIMFHELAHANIQHKTHSDTWEKEFVRLLEKHKYPREVAKSFNYIEGPNFKEWIHG